MKGYCEICTTWEELKEIQIRLYTDDEEKQTVYVCKSCKKNELKSGYYMADNTNGVYYIGKEPDCGYGEIDFTEFYDLLASSDDVLQAKFDLRFDDEALLLEKINNEYGIH